MTREAAVMMRVKIDREKCCGAGQCVLAAPEVFDQDDTDGIVILLTETVAPELEEAVRSAVDICPAQAIWVESN